MIAIASDLSGDLTSSLRSIVNVGSRVRVRVTGNHPPAGTFIDRLWYQDGTPAAHVETDDGKHIMVPIADLIPELGQCCGCMLTAGFKGLCGHCGRAAS